MHRDKLITFAELINVLENDSTDNNYKSAVDNLLEAFTDWPTQDIEEPSEMVCELKLQVKEKLTFDNLDKYLKRLEPDKDFWEIESLKSLLELFDFEQNKTVDKDIELEIIIDRITKHYRK
ncbi:MAG: hypothetical protein IH597_12790 [Bacteroidales bacterium]|nr:hypothetical protein [Bacteroidales bacterium]